MTGCETTDLGGNEQIRDLVLQNGRPLIAGNSDAGSGPAQFDFVLARYQSDSDHYLTVDVTVLGPGMSSARGSSARPTASAASTLRRSR